MACRAWPRKICAYHNQHAQPFDRTAQKIFSGVDVAVQNSPIPRCFMANLRQIPSIVRNVSQRISYCVKILAVT